MAIFVKFEREADIASGVREMAALLRQRHRLRDDQDDDFTIRNLTEAAQAADASTRTLGLLIAGVAGGCSLSAELGS